MPLTKPLFDVLDRMGFGGMLLDSNGKALALNQTAALIMGGKETAPRGGDETAWSQQALRALLRTAVTPFTLGTEVWVSIPRVMGDLLLIHAIPVHPESDHGPKTLLVLITLDIAPRANPEALQKIFGLSPAEARLAIELSCGRSTEDIADRLGVKIGTIRKQLASVFAKTGTHRQGELVALLTRIAILP